MCFMFGRDIKEKSRNRGRAAMKTRFIFGTEHEICVAIQHSTRSYGQAVPVLRENGEPIDAFSFGFHRILEATSEELESLRLAGYPPDIRKNAPLGPILQSVTNPSLVSPSRPRHFTEGGFFMRGLPPNPARL